MFFARIIAYSLISGVVFVQTWSFIHANFLPLNNEYSTSMQYGMIYLDFHESKKYRQ